MNRLLSVAVFGIALSVAASGCAGTSASTGRSASGGAASPRDTSSQRAHEPASVRLDPEQARRLQAVMVPLLRVMDHPIPSDQVKIGVMSDPHINAANAGGGEFFVTTGLLQKANDDQLRSVLAHEIAHADLGHVAKLKTLGAGLNIGMVILNQIIPGSGVLTPLAAELVARGYTRRDEYQADAHGVELLRRAGYDGKRLMASTLTWLQQTEGTSGGGFFATHPATGDRIQKVEHLPGS